METGRDMSETVGVTGDANYISFNIGDKSAKDIAEIIAQFPEVREIVFGSRTGLERWDGVVREVRELQKKIHELVISMGELQGELQKELREVKRYTRDNQDQRILRAILVILTIMTLLMLLGIVAIRRNGIQPVGLFLPSLNDFGFYLLHTL